MKIIRNASASALAEQGAIIIEEKLRGFAESKDKIVLALAGGRSLKGIYEKLAEMKSSAWTKTHFFLADERNVSLDSEESNFNLVHGVLLKPLLDKKLISEKNIHPINTSLSPESAKTEYIKELEKYGGFFDVVLLGAGEDGHIAGIFPGRNYDNSEKFCFFTDSPKPPSERFTASPSLISKASTGVVVFLGSEKKEALDRFMDLKFSETNAESALRKINDLVLLTDQY
jgi:6-phosphogluconolactonase